MRIIAYRARSDVMPKRRAIKTREQVKEEFRASGVTFKDWARRNGFSEAVVYSVMNDGRPSVRGEAHRVAVALGLKQQHHDALLSA